MKQALLVGLAVSFYMGTIVLANWLLQRYGFVSVGFGYYAPAGVYAAGISLTARDWLQELTNRWAIIGAIIAGASFSWFIAPDFALASGMAFLLSEVVDFLIYTPLREERRYLALICSNTIGAVVDSMLFLSIAFGSVAYWQGLTLGKLWTIPPAIALLWLWRTYLSERQRASAVAG